MVWYCTDISSDGNYCQCGSGLCISPGVYVCSDPDGFYCREYRPERCGYARSDQITFDLEGIYYEVQ